MKYIYHFGTFDVDNFGDLLFPFVVENKLQADTVKIIHCSPKGTKPNFFKDAKDSISSIKLNRIKDLPKAEMVIVGGGEIVRDNKAVVRDYLSCKKLAYPSLWLGAAELASLHDAPLVVNASGSTSDFGKITQPAAKRFAEMAQYIAIRDTNGQNKFDQLIGKGKVNLVFDTAFQISEVWSREDLRKLRAEELEKHGFEANTRTISFHFKDRPDTDVGDVAMLINQLTKSLSATPVLISIGPCHGDNEVQRAISQKISQKHILIDQPKSLKSIAAFISGSELFVGQSMHGFISSFSYGVPAFMIFPESYSKTTLLLKRLEMDYAQTIDWEQAAERIFSNMDKMRVQIPIAREQIDMELNAHWSEIKNIYGRPSTDSIKMQSWRTRAFVQNTWRQLRIPKLSKGSRSA